MNTSLQKLGSIAADGFQLENLSLFLANCPASLSGYRIVQLSDLHYGPCTQLEHLRRGIDLALSTKPDLILLTGDYLQYSTTGLRHILATKVSPKRFQWTEYRRQVRLLARELGNELARLQAPDGIIGVFGNHDYHEGIGSIRRQFPKQIRWLVNTSLQIQRGKDAVLVAGLDDMREGKPELARLTRESKGDDAPRCKILLSHNPDVTVSSEEDSLDYYHLVLSGHTHGGQLCLPGGFPIITRSAQKAHTSGIGMHRTTAVYVSRGMGYGTVPLRLFCPPEVTLITLQPRP